MLDFSISFEQTAYILGEYGEMQDAAILFWTSYLTFEKEKRKRYCKLFHAQWRIRGIMRNATV